MPVTQTKTISQAWTGRLIAWLVPAVFLLNLAAYVGYRYTMTPELFGGDAVRIVNDHDAVLGKGAMGSPHIPIRTVRELLSAIPADAVRFFTSETPSRYLPLTSLYTDLMMRYLLGGGPSRNLAGMAAMGLIYAAVMTLTFLFAYFFLRSILWSLLAVFLFQGAVSTLLISTQLFSLPYLLVPLVMTASFLSYLKFKETGRLRYLIVFVLGAVCGPWIREFPGAIPYVVLGAEILNFKGRRSRALLLLCFPLMLHGVFPSFLPWLLGLNHGQVFSVFGMEKTQHQFHPAYWYWCFGGFLFVQFAPSLWILIWASVHRWIGEAKTKSVWPRLARLGMHAAGLAIALAFIYSFFIANQGAEHWLYLKKPVFLALPFFVFALLSLRFHPILSLYFLATFLPFIRLSLAELHLAFTLTPLSILAVLWLRDMWARLSADRRTTRAEWGRAVFCLLLAIAVLDQGFNLVACHRTQNALTRANREISSWIREFVPRGSVMVTNFFNFVDIYLYSGYHFDPYETVENCPMGSHRVVHQPEAFQALVDGSRGRRRIFFIEGDHPFYSWQQSYHSHKYVRQYRDQLTSLAHFTARSVVAYADPLKRFVPRFFVSMLGYMDWNTDFYFNNTDRFFTRVTYSDYNIYEFMP